MMQLATADLRTRHAKCAQEFMTAKGYREIRPAGIIAVEDDQCWYYYYELPEGVLELEVCLDADTSSYRRAVTAFVTEHDRRAIS